MIEPTRIPNKFSTPFWLLIDRHDSLLGSSDSRLIKIGVGSKTALVPTFRAELCQESFKVIYSVLFSIHIIQNRCSHTTRKVV